MFAKLCAQDAIRLDKINKRSHILVVGGEADFLFSVALDIGWIVVLLQQKPRDGGHQHQVWGDPREEPEERVCDDLWEAHRAWLVWVHTHTRSHSLAHP